MPGNATEFARELIQWATVEMPLDVREAGTIAILAGLQVSHRLAAVDTGAMKAHIEPWVGSPGFLLFDPERRNAAQGQTLSGSAFGGAVQALVNRRPFERFGYASAAPYSSFVDQGTARMAAQPFFTPGVDAVRRSTVRQSELRRAA